MQEHKCRKCKKIFVPAPEHIYKDCKGLYCSWHCYNHRNDGRKTIKEKSKRVEVYDEGCLLTEFKSTKDAADFTGFPEKKIAQACREVAIYQSFLWKYKD